MRALAEGDQDIESAINLPERDEIIFIIDHALENSIYEPYVLLQKRVLQGICQNNEWCNNTPLGSVGGAKLSTFQKSHIAQSISPVSKIESSVSGLKLRAPRFVPESFPKEACDKAFKDLLQLAQVTLSEAKLLFSNKKVYQDTKCQNPSIEVHELKSYNETTLETHAAVFLPAIKPETVFKALSDPQIRKSWDIVLLDFQVMPVSQDCDQVYYVVKTPPGVSNRDFLLERRVKHCPEDGKILIHYKSIQQDQQWMSNLKEGLVRCWSNLSGYIIENDSEINGTRLIRVGKTEMNGVIPRAIIEKIAEKVSQQWTLSLFKCSLNIQQSTNSQGGMN